MWQSCASHENKRGNCLNSHIHVANGALKKSAVVIDTGDREFHIVLLTDIFGRSREQRRFALHVHMCMLNELKHNQGVKRATFLYSYISVN